MSDFWKSETAQIVKLMRSTGNQPGLIERWQASVASWALSTAGPDAEAVKAWLPRWQARPYYTAAELAPIFVVLPIALGLRTRIGTLKTPARLANELRMAGLPHFEIDGTVYFVVEQCHRAKEFEEELRNASS